MRTRFFSPLTTFWRRGPRVFTRQVAVMVTLLCTLTFLQSPHCDNEQYHLDRSLDGPLPQDDPALLRWVRQQMVPPSSLPYNLSLLMSGLLEEKDTYKEFTPSQEFILDKLDDVFGEELRTGGRFVEAGAYDGEFLSNTLWLEKEYGWSGLLVEANPNSFDKLILKRRKSWALNACLNTKPFPSQEVFTRTANKGRKGHHAANTLVFPEGNQRLLDIEANVNLASARLSEFALENNVEMASLKVQCLPLYSLLGALGWTHVDFLSLDLERAELGVLRTIPWDKVTFKVVAVEHVTDEDLTGFLLERGYRLLDKLDYDYVFVNIKHFVAR